MTIRKRLLFTLMAFPLFTGCASQRLALRDASDAPDAEYWDVSLPIAARVDDLIQRMTLDEKISQLMNASPAIERLGVPPCNWWNECLHGVARAGRATVFPQAIGMAATFDDALMRKVGEAVGREARAKYEIAKRRNPGAQYAGLTFWSPNINIFRDPRWGRGQETYGEDPCLTGRIGAAFVSGLQGDKPPYLRVAACAKHFAAHSGPEAGRDSFDSVVSDKDLNETYLPAFHTLVDAGVAGVMCAYNRVGGRPCCGDSPLISDVLRDTWKFEGYVVSDCGAIHDIHANHKVTASPVESAAMALRGGVDLNCGSVYASLREAHDQGLIDDAVIDRALRRLLTIRMRLGEFDAPDAHPFAKTNDDCVACPAHIALAKETAMKSAVLLKNANHTLPLRPDTSTVYVTGPNAASADVLLGNYRGISGNLVTILEGVVNAAGPTRRVHYNMGALLNTPNANNSNLVAYQAAGADAVIAVLGTSPLMEGESGDAIASVDGGDRSDLSLPANQLDLLRRLRSATKKPIVLVLTGGSPIISPEIHDLADAILFAWYPGEAGGAAIGDLIFGRAAPSGRLPISFPMSLDDLPPYEDYQMRGRTYRFATTEPLYPFGFGLSYATFHYSGATLESSEISDNAPLVVQFQLTNVGGMDAEEVVQYYLTPMNVVPDAPQYALCGFQRVRLKPGESRMIVRSIPTTDLTTTDAEGRRVTRPGRYRLTIGGAAPGARAESLGAPTPLTTEFTILADQASPSRDVTATHRN
ncbi:MAG TPA: glycoside hydrolase family 3 N-terminal domain-containing protein [Phycisphaerae bacterium]|nr:glycoside hydrolase family 3 N-terminal domain-containing protein [Phycisphaerae bacterium]HRW54401.1 glycoside hydrolase family 3 N-terminal domain-containing protein [Phycisphaerae bacterium]